MRSFYSLLILHDFLVNAKMMVLNTTKSKESYFLFYFSKVKISMKRVHTVHKYFKLFSHLRLNSTIDHTTIKPITSQN